MSGGKVRVGARVRVSVSVRGPCEGSHSISNPSAPATETREHPVPSLLQARPPPVCVCEREGEGVRGEG